MPTRLPDMRPRPATASGRARRRPREAAPSPTPDGTGPLGTRRAGERGRTFLSIRDLVGQWPGAAPLPGVNAKYLEQRHPARPGSATPTAPATPPRPSEPQAGRRGAPRSGVAPIPQYGTPRSPIGTFIGIRIARPRRIRSRADDPRRRTTSIPGRRSAIRSRGRWSSAHIARHSACPHQIAVIFSIIARADGAFPATWKLMKTLQALNRTTPAPSIARRVLFWPPERPPCTCKSSGGRFERLRSTRQRHLGHPARLTTPSWPPGTARGTRRPLLVPTMRGDNPRLNSSAKDVGIVRRRRTNVVATASAFPPLA